MEDRPFPSARSLAPSDRAHALLKRYLADARFALRADPDMNEAETRAKLIDPLFKDVLGWSENEVRREEPTAEGYADYVFGASYAYLHVEAKRTAPRFAFAAPGRERFLELRGAHLLGNKELRPLLEQTAKYALDLGTDFCMLTNGDQFVAFRPHLKGRKWREGMAMIWYDYRDIEDKFGDFYSWMARDRILAGALIEAFERADTITTTLHSPLEFVHNADAELVRNRFWTRISGTVGPLLTDDPESLHTLDEIIRNCYVRTPLSDQADRSIDSLLRDVLPEELRDAQLVDLKPGMHGQTAFDISLERDIKDRKPGTYLLTGGVGSGKTTFLRRYTHVVRPDIVKEYCVWLHVDFLSIGNLSQDRLAEELRAYTFRTLRTLLQTDYPRLWPQTSDGVKRLFRSRLQEATLTSLAGLQEGTPEWTSKVSTILEQAFADNQLLVEQILLHSTTLGLRPVIVLDNTDQQGETFQESVFLMSQRLSKDCGALTIVSLREEKFFAAFRRGIFDAYGDRRFHVGSPSLNDVIRRRLDYTAVQK